MHVTERRKKRGRTIERERRHRERSKVDTLTAVFDSPVSLCKHAQTHRNE